KSHTHPHEAKTRMHQEVMATHVVSLYCCCGHGHCPFLIRTPRVSDNMGNTNSSSLHTYLAHGAFETSFTTGSMCVANLWPTPYVGLQIRSSSTVEGGQTR
ncbi:unnamed protein product, partial [Ectocarpus fasciculatus]